MKKLLIVISIILSVCFFAMAAYGTRGTGAVEPDKTGHVLKEQWEAYAAASRKDRPAKSIEILRGIIGEAEKRRLSRDFYDAWRAYADVSGSVNWKTVDSLSEAFGSAVRKYDEPVVTVTFYADGHYNFGKEYFDMVAADSARLKAGRNEAFYRGGETASLMYGLLPGYISDDYEYALWLGRGYSALESYPYPSGAYAEYMKAGLNRSAEERKKALGSLAAKYRGRAVGMFAEGDLLSLRLDSLSMKEEREEDFKSLYSDCLDFEKRRKSLKGAEAGLAKEYADVKGLVETLEGKDAFVYVAGKEIVAAVRNLPSVELSVFPEDGGKKPLWKAVLNNPARRFYVSDTLRTVVPVLDDGDYLLKAGDYGSWYWNKFSLSLAARQEYSGFGVYVAGAESGKPLGRADLNLLKNGSVVASVRDFALKEGFTPLPASFREMLKGGNGAFYLNCSAVSDKDSTVRKSNNLRIWLRHDFAGATASGEVPGCDIFLDRAAYNPGDTVRFKSILYNSDPHGVLRVAGEGTAVKAVMNDSEGNGIGEISLSTNSFGSVAGEFPIPSGLRNGMFSIEIDGEEYGGDKYFRVDEFIAPTFGIGFDDVGRLYFPGDTVRVSGQLTAYSGHMISDAHLRYKVDSWGGRVSEGEAAFDGEGRFTVFFVAKEQSMYSVELTATDLTGESVSAVERIGVFENISVDAVLLNSDGAVFGTEDNSVRRDNLSTDSDTAVFRIHVRSYTSAEIMPVEVRYELKDAAGNMIYEGKAASGDEVRFDLGSFGQGLFTLRAFCSLMAPDGDEVKGEKEVTFLKMEKDADVLEVPLKNYYKLLSDEVEAGDDIGLLFGASDGRPVWAVMEIFGEERKLLESRSVRLSGEAGGRGSLEKIAVPYLSSYPDEVFVRIFYFKDYGTFSFESRVRRRSHVTELPLRWLSFQDRTLPGRPYSFELRTDPETEILAAVYDKSIDAVAQNRWNKVMPAGLSVPYVNVSYEAGGNSSYYGGIFGHLNGVAPGGRMSSPRLMAKGAAMMNADMADGVVEEVAVEDSVPASDGPAVETREVFAGTLAFEPFLRSDVEGNARLDFSTSGKLSTYKVMLFAHDRNMRNEVLTREMTVTLPVKLSVFEPKYLYVGDKYELTATLSSSADSSVSGSLRFFQYVGVDYRRSEPVVQASEKVSISPGETLARRFTAAVPSEEGEIGIRLEFVPDGEQSLAGDAMFVSIPVYADVQKLTEAHSAVILPGTDMEAAMETLRSAFVNTSHKGAEYKEISVKDMLVNALSSESEPGGDDVLSLSEALYVRLVAAKLGVVMPSSDMSDAELLAKILSCRNADGGFAWFESMDSSPVITAVLLERFAKLRRASLLDEDLTSSVKYLDNSQFSMKRPNWCGGLSYPQYLHVRSLYPTVPFSPEGGGRDFDALMKSFRKYVRGYLVPKGDRGLNGAILPKARRIMTLSNLLSSDAGRVLAKKWGVVLSGGKKMRTSLDEDTASLLEYAVEHREGGMYYPDAVMPFRGLLESEVYAHSLICDLLTRYAGDSRTESGPAAEAMKVADGIRIWLMLQKETQMWGAEPAYADAVNSVLSGSDELPAVKVIVLRKTYEKPFAEIKASGNGFKIERIFLREVTSADPDREGRTVTRFEEIKEGDILEAGDKIRVEYRIENGENRSFVLLRAPREANLRPVNQLSGFCGFSFRPMRVNSWYSVVPRAYRNVKAAVTEFYFDSYPEEKSSVYEDFHVAQRGVFTAPATEIESLYAPHYRANTAVHTVTAW